MNTYLAYDEDWTFVETKAEMITAIGAESLKEMFESGMEPDDRIWSKVVGGRFIIETGSVRLEWCEHKLTLNGMEIVGIDVDHSSEDVIYSKRGWYFQEAGCLVFSTTDRCTVRVPFVFDVPIRSKEWLV